MLGGLLVHMEMGHRITDFFLHSWLLNWNNQSKIAIKPCWIRAAAPGFSNSGVCVFLLLFSFFETEMLQMLGLFRNKEQSSVEKLTTIFLRRNPKGVQGKTLNDATSIS